MGLGEVITGTLIGTVAGEAVKPVVANDGQGSSGAALLWAIVGAGVGAWLAWTYRDDIAEWIEGQAE